MVEGVGLVGLMAALFALYLSQSRGLAAFRVILAYVICYKAYFKPWKYVAVAMLRGFNWSYLSYQSAGTEQGSLCRVGSQVGRGRLI
jgi:hypothetical protein